MRGLRDVFPTNYVTSGREDVHVHTHACDDAEQSPSEALEDASARGLTFVCFTAHVRESTTTNHVTDYIADAKTAATRFPEIEVRCSVETKLMNSKGELDLPRDLDLTLLDTVHISDHQFPLESATSPEAIVAGLADHSLDEEFLWESLRDAYRGSLRKYPGAIVAHPLSIIPKIGLAANEAPDWFCSDLAREMNSSSAVMEINEKWRCPSIPLLNEAMENGVPIVAASDAHKKGATGVTTYLTQTLPALGLAHDTNNS